MSVIFQRELLNYYVLEVIPLIELDYQVNTYARVTANV